MRVDLELDGTRRTVEVRPDGDRWLVMLEGREIVASAAGVGDRWSLLIDGPADAGDDAGPPVASGIDCTQRSYEISFESRAQGELVVYVNGQAVPLSIVDPRAAFMRRAADRTGGRGAGAAGPTSIVAPMPGRVVRVLVEAGDDVGARQGLVVVEAMKMENELRAPRAGTVAGVRVTEGMSVEANAVLMILE